MLYHTWLISHAPPRTHTHADVGAVFYLKSSHDLHWHSQKFSCYQLVLKNSSKKLNQLWFVAWGRKCFTKVIFSKAVSKRYCKHDRYSCPCCWCFKQTQAEEAESVRKERESSREDGKQRWENQKCGDMPWPCSSFWEMHVWSNGKGAVGYEGRSLAQVRWQLCCWVTFGIPEIHWLLPAKGTE